MFRSVADDLPRLSPVPTSVVAGVRQLQPALSSDRGLHQQPQRGVLQQESHHLGRDGLRHAPELVPRPVLRARGDLGPTSFFKLSLLLIHSTPLLTRLVSSHCIFVDSSRSPFRFTSLTLAWLCPPSLSLRVHLPFSRYTCLSPIFFTGHELHFEREGRGPTARQDAYSRAREIRYSTHIDAFYFSFASCLSIP